MANIIDGKKYASAHQEKLQKTLIRLKAKPKVVSILVGDDPASLMYTEMKQKKASELGIDFEFITLPENVSYEEVVETIKSLNKDKSITGVMVQLPLPKKVLGERLPEELLNNISPKKDVDGLTGKGRFLPAVCKAVISLIRDEEIKVKDQYCVVIGSSPTVGLPIAKQLKKLGGRVVVCDINTKNLREETLKAEILVSATGVAGLVIGKMVQDGVVVFDVGFSKVGDKIEGDVDLESVEPRASKITPVPGGVGPMTIISLMENVTEAVMPKSS